MTLFKKILIANRGEIACRIIKTCKKLGITTVGIFSEADMNALHTKMLDEAIFIGPSPSNESYLNAKKVIEIAKQTKAEAIHPGYGFLSENSEFAQLCEDAGICFIGPSAKCIQLMGEKRTAKEIVAKHYIPVLPDYKGENQDESHLLREADKIGYPILIKAACGGGGKGMRIVNSKKEFKNALLSAKRESLASFGDDRVFLEKYLEGARHIEVQILADKYHNMITLFERDCSIQRRHQKILEEAPAPHISENLRDQLRESALIAARTISYYNVGTVEFLVTENENFYFIEMNTRLQVEHPVTELVSGIDLVEWQIRVASGEQLPFSQPLKTKGHAIEVRICAEDPEKNFLPATGEIIHFKFPTCEKIRIDTGFAQGDYIHVFYDSLIAKLIVASESRESTLLKLNQVLSEIEIVGVTTNLNLLKEIINDPDFHKAKLNTHFLEKNHILSKLQSKSLPPIVLVFAGMADILREQYLVETNSRHQSDYSSPWLKKDFWLVNQLPQIQSMWVYQNKNLQLHIILHRESFEVCVGDAKYFITPIHINFISDNLCELEIKIENHYEFAKLVWHKELSVIYKGDQYNLQKITAEEQAASHLSQGHLRSPMPGTIIEVLVNQGQTVNKGDKLLVIEAMKMEHAIYAPENGVVSACYYTIGDLIEEGTELLEIKPGMPL